MKHTPGPWEATPGGIVGKRVTNGSRDLICDLRESPFVDDIPFNTLLIAASPDLLEACKNGLDLLCRCCKALNPNYHNCTSCKDVKPLKRAIAKAEGE